MFPTLKADSLLLSHQGSLYVCLHMYKFVIICILVTLIYKFVNSYSYNSVWIGKILSLILPQL